MNELELPIIHFDNALQDHEIDYLFYLLEKEKDWITPVEAGTALVEGKPLKQAQSLKLNTRFRVQEPYPFITNDIFNLFGTVNLELDQGIHHWVWRYLASCNVGSVIAAKYSKGDYYAEHTDSCKLSAVLTLARNPDKVLGGDHVFEGGTTIPFTHNRLILFPSIVLHEVTEVLSDEERYSITIFLDTDPTIEEISRKESFDHYQAVREEEINE